MEKFCTEGPYAPPVLSVLDDLATRHDLLNESGTSVDGLPERSLYSHDMLYRYAFGRWWGTPDLARTAVWVLLNPATGDTEKRRRPTLDRCIRWSKAAGHDGIMVLNIFGYRATNPKVLRTVEDPVGPHTDEALQAITTAGALTVVAWGSHGRLHRRSTEVAGVIVDPQCLGTTSRGEPRHPLYVRGDTRLTPWSPPEVPRRVRA